MSVGDELQHSLRAMGFLQLLALLLFVAGYALSLGRFVGAVGRGRAALLAATSAVAFCALTQPWVHGVLLMAGAVGVMGMFIAVVSLTSRWLGLARGRDESGQDPDELTSPVGLTHPASPSGRGSIGAGRRAVTKRA